MINKLSNPNSQSDNSGSSNDREFKGRVERQDIDFFAACMRGIPTSRAAQDFLNMPRWRSDAAHRWALDRLESHARKNGCFSAPRLLRVVLSRDRHEAHLQRVSARRVNAEDGSDAKAEIEQECRGNELSRVAREVRVIRRQEALLAKLAAMIVERPRLGDDVSDWFDLVVTGQFEKLGVLTIGALYEFVTGTPITWHKRIPRLGRPSAKYVTSWLHAHASSLGLDHRLLPALDKASASQVVWEKSTDMVPLERFHVPQELDGGDGENRGRYLACDIPCASDMEAITHWLEIFTGRPAHKRYRCEAERVLFWTILVKKKAFSSLTPADCDEYLNVFLTNVQPPECWIGPPTSRQSKDWRPFVDQPTGKSRMSARSALFTLGQYLSQHRYLRTNPFYTVSLREKRETARTDLDEFTWQRGTVNLSEKRAVRQRRVLSENQWSVVLASANRLSSDVLANARLQFALHFSLETGLSRAELANASSSDLYVSREDEGAMWLLIRANGRKPARCIPLGEKAQRVLADYFELRGYGHRARGWPAGVPLVPVIEQGRLVLTNRPMKADGVSDMFKAFFVKASAEISLHDPDLAATLATVNTRWMRESFAFNSVKAGMRDYEVAYLIGDRSIQLLFPGGFVLACPVLEAVAFSNNELAL